jgi:hypothetical protein
MSNQLCTEPPFNYSGKNITKQKELDINNIQYFLQLYYSGTYFKDGCGPGDLYIKTLLFDEKKSFKQRTIIIDPTTIIIIRNDLLVTITNLSFNTKKFDLTYIKLNSNVNVDENYYFAINFWEDSNNIYYFDLIITISLTGIIYKINRLSAKSDGVPQITIQNNNICMIYNNEILIQKPIMDFFYFSFFGENSNIYELNKYLPIRVEIPRLNIFDDLYFDTTTINKINQEEINIDFINKNSNLSYNAKTYKQIFSNNIDKFVARSDTVLNVPLDVEYPEIIFRRNVLKDDKRPTYIAGALFLITFVLFLIILVLFILEKRKHQCKVIYS